LASTALLARITGLNGLIAAHEARIVALTDRNAVLASRITDHETRIAEITARNSELATAITAHEARIPEIEARNIALQTQITTHQDELDTLQASCDAGGSTGAGGTTSADLYYLHTDHLGKPQFATDEAGATVWDAGTPTPFGDGVQLASAFTQRLQFPGQYYDEETTLSHNHHRTYDPALGRYLQSDPIGLAGGINRYAYVGGNPMGAVDPMGLGYAPPGALGHGSLEYMKEVKIGWYVIDLPGPGEKKECRCGVQPKPEDDIDFFYYNNEWQKVWNGDVRITKKGIKAKRYHKFPFRTYFSAKNPPWYYKWKAIKDYEKNGEKPPMAYLRSLKNEVKSCKNLPGL